MVTVLGTLRSAELSLDRLTVISANVSPVRWRVTAREFGLAFCAMVLAAGARDSATAMFIGCCATAMLLEVSNSTNCPNGFSRTTNQNLPAIWLGICALSERGTDCPAARGPLFVCTANSVGLSPAAFSASKTCSVHDPLALAAPKLARVHPTLIFCPGTTVTGTVTPLTARSE